MHWEKNVKNDPNTECPQKAGKKKAQQTLKISET